MTTSRWFSRLKIFWEWLPGWLGLLLATALGMGLAAYATTWGPGVGGDATIYLTAARNLITGRGLGWYEADGVFRLLPYTPPFYPLVLSLLGLLQIDLVAGARWLNVIMFGGLLFVTGWAFQYFTGRKLLGILLAGILAVSPVILNVQVWAMSESLFLLVGFSGLMLLVYSLEKPNRHRRMVTAALLLGLACLTRYIGAAFIAAGFLTWLLLAKQTWNRKMADLALFALVSSVPVLIWLAIDYQLTGTVASRSGQAASDLWARFLSFFPPLLDIYLFWLVPGSIVSRMPYLLKAAALVLPLLAGGMLVVEIALRLHSQARIAVRKQADLIGANNPFAVWLDSGGVRFTVAMLFFITSYLVLLAVVHVFTYPPVTLASRMLSPVHFAVVALLAALLHLVLQGWQSDRWLPAAGYAAFGLLFLVYAGRGALVVRDMHQIGIGYTAREWRSSELVDAIRKIPAQTPIISNDVTAVQFLANRPAYNIPEIFRDQPLSSFTRFGDSTSEREQVIFREQGGVLVLFNATLASDFSMYGSKLDARLKAFTEGLRPVFESPQGTIYIYATDYVPPSEKK
ncbi:MAG TPA: hypothetical protein VIO61_04330 [Anaerolineaceae bacterium]